MFEASEKFESVECQIEGLGRIRGVQDLYIAHTQAAIDAEPLSTVADDVDTDEEKSAVENADLEDATDSGEGEETSETVLPDGTYDVKFTTDSSMFHVNEALNDMGVLTVKDGKMTVHVSLAGDGIINLFPGVAKDAAKDGAELLEPTEDEITYDDGTSEVVYGFDIPVPALDSEFDVALIGKKGVWYDHKVSVASPETE